MVRKKVLLAGVHCENFVIQTGIAIDYHTILTLDFPFTGPASITSHAFESLNLE